MYLLNTRVDMCYVVNQLSQALVRKTKLFWKETSHVLWYLRDTTQFGLWYRRKEGVKLCDFIDADWEGIITKYKSTSGGIFSVRSTTTFWYNMKKIFVTLNSIEA